MTEIFRTLIVPAADAPLARQIALTLSPVGGSGMWLAGLSPSGQEPATHYVSTGLIGPDFAMLVPCTFWAQEDGDWVCVGAEFGNAALVVAACGAVDPPLALTEKQVQELMNEADISEQEPFVAYSRMGLKLISEEMP